MEAKRLADLKVPPPMLRNNWESPSDKCFIGERAGGPPSAAPSSHRTRPPSAAASTRRAARAYLRHFASITPANVNRSSRARRGATVGERARARGCGAGESLRDIVDASSDFKWANDVPAHKKPKFGFISDVPGHTLRLKLDTRPPAKMHDQDKVTAVPGGGGTPVAQTGKAAELQVRRREGVWGTSGQQSCDVGGRARATLVEAAELHESAARRAEDRVADGAGVVHHWPP